jgi:hypothetical protein
MSRPLIAEDPTIDMSIYANPDNSKGYPTTYTFRGKFGPTDKSEDLKYTCADQTIDFSTFYATELNYANTRLLLSAALLAMSTVSVLF